MQNNQMKILEISNRHLISKFLCLLQVVFVVLVLTSCAAMSKEDCWATDWFMKGTRDGTEGHPATQFRVYEEACMEHSILLSADNRTDYQKGLQKGYETYCTSNNGYYLGYAGKGHKGVCPVHLRQDFNHAYSIGEELYYVNVEVRRQDNEISFKRSEIRSLERDIRKLTKELNSDEVEASAKAGHPQKINQKQNEISHLLAEITPLMIVRDSANQRCEEVRRKHRNMGYPVPGQCG